MKHNGFKATYTYFLSRLRLVGLIIWGCCIFLTLVLSLSMGSRVLSLARIVNLFAPFCYIMGPIFTLICFSYLKKRRNSDFLHSLPFSRATLYNSATLATLTWSAIILASSLAVGAVCIFVSGVCVNYACFPVAFFILLLITMMIYAAGAIACSITGTTATNIIAFVSVFLLPRMILGICASTLTREVSANAGVLLNPAYNMAVYPIFSSGLVEQHFDAYMNIWTYVYSFGLMIAELGLGLVLFKKRKSEAAGAAGANNFVQNVLSVCIPFSYLISFFALLRSKSGSYLSFYYDFDFLTLSILIVAALVAFLIFQLVVYRKFTMFLKHLPYLLASAVLSFLLIALTGVYNKALISAVPNPDDITGIYQITSVNYETYGKKRLNELNLSSPEMNRFIVKWINEEASEIELSAEQGLFRIEVGDKVYYRNIVCPYDEFRSFVCGEFFDVFYSLPEYSGDKIRIEYRSYLSQAVADSIDSETLYNCIREDRKNFAAQSKGAQSSYITESACEDLTRVNVYSSHTSLLSKTVGTAEISGIEGFGSYENYVYISYEEYPITFRYIVSLHCQAQKIEPDILMLEQDIYFIELLDFDSDSITPKYCYRATSFEEIRALFSQMQPATKLEGVIIYVEDLELIFSPTEEQCQQLIVLLGEDNMRLANMP